MVTKRLAVTALLLTVARTSPCLAQVIHTSSIVGTVFDTSGAVVRQTKITLEGSKLIGGPIDIASDAMGEYRFPALPPGRYTIVGRLAGFADAQRRDIDLPVDTTLTVDLVLTLERVVAQVDVSEPLPPVVDVRSAAAPARVNQRMLENLPSLRSVAQVINLAPGVSAGVGFGGTQDSNALYVDGVNMNELQYHAPYLRVNYNWLQEVEVAAIGAGPEYGQSTGVTANAVLRSGSNRLSGLAETLTTAPSWLARNTSELSEDLQRDFEPLQLVNWWDTSLQAGGPIVRDRLWYFAGVQTLRHEYQPAGYSGPGASREAEEKALFKVTTALSPSARLDASIQPGWYRVESEDIGPQTPTEASTDLRQPQTMWNARLHWARSGRWLLEVRNGGYQGDTREGTHPPATREGPPSHLDLLTRNRSVSALFYFDGHVTKYTTSATVTTYGESRLGRHDLRFGAEFEHGFMANAAGFTGGMAFADFGTTPRFVTFWDGQTLHATSRRTTLFAGDDWRFGRITVSPGVRVDVNRGSVPLVDDVFATNPIAPRLGVAWDPLNSHRLVLRAHGGRYYDPTFLGRISTIDVSQIAPRIEADVVAPGQYVETFRSGSFASSMTIDPNLKHSHVDQVTGGIEWQVERDVSVQANIIYRDFGSFMSMTDIGRRWSPTTAQDPGPDGVLGTSDDGAFLTVYREDPETSAIFFYSNPNEGYRRYRGLQVIGRRRFSRFWEAQASYTWSRTDGTVDNGNGTNAAINDLGTGGGFSNPNRFINQRGRSPYDPREVKLLADASVPWGGGFTIGAIYRYTSGQAWARRAFMVFGGGGDAIKVEPRGSRRLPAINNLDLRIEKLIPVGRSARLGVSADLFNVTNQAVPNSDVDFPVNVFSGPNLGDPWSWRDPRLLRIGVRMTF